MATEKIVCVYTLFMLCELNPFHGQEKKNGTEEPSLHRRCVESISEATKKSLIYNTTLCVVI